MDMVKRDMTLTRGGRTFTVRAYLDGRDPAGAGWHAVIVENRTPLRHELPPALDADACLDAAVRFLTAAVAADTGDVTTPERDEGDRHSQDAWESEGGASAGNREAGGALQVVLPRQSDRHTAAPGITGGTLTP